MRQQGFENVIPIEICKQIKDFFDDNTDLHKIFKKPVKKKIQINVAIN